MTVSMCSHLHTMHPAAPTPCLLNQGGDLKNDMQLFVRPGLNTLALAGAHWLLMGFSAPDHAMEMAAGGMTGRRKVREAVVALCECRI